MVKTTQAEQRKGGFVVFGFDKLAGSSFGVDGVSAFQVSLALGDSALGLELPAVLYHILYYLSQTGF